MCQEKCPVKINTGELIKQLRSDEMAEAPRASKMAMVGGAFLFIRG
jgi:D-lactate dehydrogenase